MKPIIRNYKITDFDQVIQLIKLNTPTYFAHKEETDLQYYLAFEIQTLKNNELGYFVIEFNNVIVGSGGINLFENKTIARISWDIIHPKYQGKGFGKLLLTHRLNYLKKEFKLEKIVVRTSQLVFEFYEKAGFKLKEIHQNYWEKGFDMYVMEIVN